jgi:hypothetical protein
MKAVTIPGNRFFFWNQGKKVVNSVYKQMGKETGKMVY